ncbi:alpha/beta hydrolase [Psychrobacillus vulpis]|uniref:Alpha/beta hydrolase n=1 Tax=Psychrobacillus vulpis TaxID=2325572 RepID=A0A544TKR5_9BACI|nr:alpha/beta hydrolase [Psychrobacillus vulpis]TQR18025.1 alpha/beta hydrolase [Psychrobacillus vulpis]
MWKWEADEKPKAVIVIVHSAYEHHRRYAWLIEKFRSSNCHIVMGDLPGHGDHTSKRDIHNESFDQYKDYITHALQVAVAYNLPIFILGHGLGATLLMKVMNKLQIEYAGVILTSPWLQLKKLPSKWTKALAKLSVQQKIHHDIQLKELTRNYEVYKQFVDDPAYDTLISNHWYKELQLMMKSIMQATESVPNVPVLLMTAERDKITENNVAVGWLKKQELTEFQYKQWKNCFHDLYQEPEREEIFAYSHSFINNVLRSIGYIV